MNDHQSVYEIMPHGVESCPIAFYAERKWDAPLHHHREYEVFWVAEGIMRFYVAGQEYFIQPGTFVFIEPNVPHAVLDTVPPVPRLFHALVFGAAALGSEDDPSRIILDSVQINRFITLPATITDQAKLLHDMLRRGEFGAEMCVKTFLYSILTYVLQTKQYMLHSSLHSANLRSTAAVRQMIEFIESHYAEKISLDDVLPSLSYSKSHVARLFREATGCSFVFYLNRYRIEKSCMELLYTDKSICDIAIDNGFNNVQYFSKMFRENTGMTPGKYRTHSRGYQLPVYRQNRYPY